MDTTDYNPDDTAAPTIARVWTIPAAANTIEQTAVMFSDGTRITVAADGRVKAGRDWHLLDRADVKVRNHNAGRGWPDNGSPATAFLTFYTSRRDDHPAEH